MSIGVDTDQVLAGLKDFQRATVEHAFHRLFDAPDSTRRFLVADEVGLGKTMVARGVVARAIDRLDRDGVGRIDIVYICSNGDIAAQNVRKLDVTGTGAARASRLTLLAKQVHDLRDQALNLVALTPGTSFQQSGGAGRADERVLLYWLLREAWLLGDRAAPKNVLQGWVRSAEDFRYRLRAFDRTKIDAGIADEFVRTLDHRIAKEAAEGHPSIRERFDVLCYEFGRTRARVPHDQTRRRDALIGELRGLLAAACVEALEPDLVILDEFQRFRHLLVDDPDSEAASLARALFDWERPESGEHARVLLLSATPYRALTVAGDGGDDDHHEDFLATVRFLADSHAPADELRGLLREYQRGLYGDAPEASEQLRTIRVDIEALLTRYIARTERIGAAGQHDAMLRHVPRIASPTPARPAPIPARAGRRPRAGSARRHRAVEERPISPELPRRLQAAQPLRRGVQGGRPGSGARGSAQHDEGRLARSREAAGLRGRRSRRAAHARARQGRDRQRGMAVAVDPALNALLRARGRVRTSGAKGLHKAARLLRVARRPACSGRPAQLPRRAAARARSRPRARRTRQSAGQASATGSPSRSGRTNGAPACQRSHCSTRRRRSPTVADPRAFAIDHREGAIAELLTWAREQIAPLLDRLPPGAAEGDVDERWYWAAPLMLDALVDWWAHPDLAAEWTDWDKRASAQDSRWQEHVELARSAADGTLEPTLGRRPDDLPDVLARFAIGGPGTLALRALTRVTGLPASSLDARLAAARGSRGRFADCSTRPRQPRCCAPAARRREDTYWREVMRHCIDGCLQAVLDEHAHVLMESEGATNEPAEEAAATVADAMIRALALRASRVNYSHLAVTEVVGDSYG